MKSYNAIIRYSGIGIIESTTAFINEHDYRGVLKDILGYHVLNVLATEELENELLEKHPTLYSLTSIQLV